MVMICGRRMAGEENIQLRYTLVEERCRLHVQRRDAKRRDINQGQAPAREQEDM